MAAAVSAYPNTALRGAHARGTRVDHTELPSPVLAVASLLAFSLGALAPLLPYVVGLPALAATLVVTAVALTVGGIIVGRLTGRPLLRSGLGQLALGLAIAVTFAVGSLIGRVWGPRSPSLWCLGATPRPALAPGHAVRHGQARCVAAHPAWP